MHNKKCIKLILVLFIVFFMNTLITPSIKVKASSVYGDRPLIGVIYYNGTHDVKKVPDELSLTPPHWGYRLPFYASVTNDNSRLVRTSNTQQEIVYKVDTGINKCILYTAYNDTESFDPTTDILVYKSSDGVNYTQYTYGDWDVRKINHAIDWQKVTYEITLNSEWDKYIKIVVCKTDGSVRNPQIMRLELFYKNTVGNDNNKLVDDFDDFSKIHSHSEGWTFATDNTNKFRLVTADDNTQAIMDQQIAYANSAHIDYITFIDDPKYYWPSNFALFRSSAKRGNLQYCVIVHGNTGEAWSDRVNRLVSYFGDSFYVKVLDGRPLVYLFDQSIWTKSDIDELRNASIAAGYGNPYVVGMAYNNEDYSSFCDAGSCYLTKEPVVIKNYVGTTKTIPLISYGANELPRVDNPVPWGNGRSNTAEITGDSLIPYINEGIQWIKENPDAAEANCLLINSWNEHCESAVCIEPRLNPDGSINTTNLISVGKALKPWEATGTTDKEQSEELHGENAETIDNYHGFSYVYLSVTGYQLSTEKDEINIELGGRTVDGDEPDWDSYSIEYKTDHPELVEIDSAGKVRLIDTSSQIKSIRIWAELTKENSTIKSNMENIRISSKPDPLNCSVKVLDDARTLELNIRDSNMDPISDLVANDFVITKASLSSSVMEAKLMIENGI
jgi:hypothetical protein